MPYNNIDEIRIRINGTNDSAVAAIDKTADRLKSLKAAMSDLNKTDLAATAKALEAFSQAASSFSTTNMKGLTSFLGKLKTLQSVDANALASSASGIAKAIRELSTVTFASSEGLANGAKALSRLVSGINRFDPENAKGFANAIKEIVAEAKSLNDIDTKKLEALATAMRYNSLSQRTKTKINDAAKDLGDREVGGGTSASAESKEQGPVSESTNDRLARFNARIKTAIKHMLSFKSASRSAGHATSGLAGKLRGLISDFSRILKYRMLRSFIRMITQSFTTGIKNAYQYAVATGNQFQATMDRMATTALYVKNSLGAMAMPLLNTLAPALDYVADKFVALLNTINQFIASITGQATWTKALRYTKSFGDGTANAANGAKKAADDLKATILGIDEINLLNDNNERAGSGGSGGAAADDYSAMFETVETKASKFSQTLKDLFQPFKDAWDNVGAGVMDQWEYATSSINDLLSDVGTTFKNVWTGGTGQKIIENILLTWQNIETTIGNLAGKLKEAWDANGNGERIAKNIFGIFESISGIAEEISEKFVEWSAEVDFEPLVGAVAEFTSAVKDFIDDCEPLIIALTEALGAFATWAVEDILPGVTGFLTDLTRFGSALVGSISALFNGDIQGAKSAWTDYTDYVNHTGKYAPKENHSREAYIQQKRDDLLEGLGLSVPSSIKHDRQYKEASANAISAVMNWMSNGFEKTGNPIFGGNYLGKIFERPANSIAGVIEDLGWSLLFPNGSEVAKAAKENGASLEDWIFNKIFNGGSGTGTGNSVGGRGSKKMKVTLSTQTDDFSKKMVDVLSHDKVEKEVGYKPDPSSNGVKVKEWFNTKDETATKTLKSKVDPQFNSNKTIYDTTYKNGDATKSLKSKLIEFFKPQSTWTDTYKDENATKTLKSRLDALFRNNVSPWSNTYTNSTVTKTLTSALTSQFTSNKNTYNGLQSKTVTGTLDAEKTANFTQLTKEYVDLKSGTKKLTFDTEFKVKLKLDAGNDKTTITENVLNGRISYASGGFPASGQVFFANEDGSSEYIGKFGNQTAVANNDQIVQGIAQGVSSAQAEQNRLLREQNELLRAIYNKEGRSNGTTSSDVLRALNQTSRRTGHPVVSMG